MTNTRAWAVLAIAVLTFGACGGDDDGTSEPSDTSVRTTTTTAAATTTTVAIEQTVRVYFLDADAHLATAGRTVTGADPARAALDALLSGPEGVETEVGMSSAIPAGTEVLDLTLDDGVWRVDLTGAFASGGGSASMLGRVAQVVYTLTQFDTAQTVLFSLDGVPVDTIGGEGVVVDGTRGGVDRSAFDAALPAILVEAPMPGAEVTSPITFSGLNNTFESTVNYTLTDPEGLILLEAFATGTGGVGEWGPFETAIEFTTERHGLGSLIVYEISAEDGSRQSIVEVPITM